MPFIQRFYNPNGDFLWEDVVEFKRIYRHNERIVRGSVEYVVHESREAAVKTDLILTTIDVVTPPTPTT
jgi:hypothetical protein